MKLSFNIWKICAVLSLIAFTGLIIFNLTVGTTLYRKYEFLTYIALFNIALAIYYGVKNHND